jgi:hypothetical protein
MRSGFALNKIMPARDAKLAFILVADRLHGQDAHLGFFEVMHCDANIDDGFRRHAGNGCAADVLDLQHMLADGSQYALFFLLIEAGPIFLVRYDFYDAPFQAQYHLPRPECFTCESGLAPFAVTWSSDTFYQGLLSAGGKDQCEEVYAEEF